MPRDLNLGLTADQRAARKLGGSDANILMSGDEAKILRLWEEKTGQREPEDLTGILPVVMGQWSEELNRYWFEKQTGREITREGESLTHGGYPFMTATLDGVTATGAGIPALFEAKHVGGFEAPETVVDRYQPQLHHAGAVAGLGWAVLSIFSGNSKWEFYEVELDPLYTMELIEREAAFWKAVEAKEPPVAMPAVAAPVAPEKWRVVDMGGNNAWAQWAGDWVQNRKAATRFKDAEKEIKELMESDVGHAYGGGIQCKRAKNGSLRITELKGE